MFMTSAATGRVSVIIPTCQSARNLPVCFQSLAEQSYAVDEVIVVDAYSSDGTVRIASEHGAKVIVASGTQAAARNVGLLHSKGDYLLFLDSDQQLEEGVVEDCVSKCAKDRADAVKIPEVFVGATFWGRCSALWKNAMAKAMGPRGGIPRFYKRGVLPKSSVRNGGLRFWDDLELYQRVKGVTLRKEAWSNARVFHHEAFSLREIATKYLSYGRSAAGFRSSSLRAPYESTIRLGFSTALHLLQNPGRSPITFLGCHVQLLVKTLSATIGFLAR
jgi:glycosyltransferase involved in cell wall biosynthesis